MIIEHRCQVIALPCMVKHECEFCDAEQAHVFVHFRYGEAAADKFYCHDCASLEWWLKCWERFSVPDMLDSLMKQGAQIRAADHYNQNEGD